MRRYESKEVGRAGSSGELSRRRLVSVSAQESSPGPGWVLTTAPHWPVLCELVRREKQKVKEKICQSRKTEKEGEGEILSAWIRACGGEKQMI